MALPAQPGEAHLRPLAHRLHPQGERRPVAARAGRRQGERRPERLRPAGGGRRRARRPDRGRRHGTALRASLPAGDRQGRRPSGVLETTVPDKRPEESGRYVRLTGSPEEPIVSPVALAFDEASHLYLTDSSGKVFGFRRAGRAALGQPRGRRDAWQRPTGLAYSPERRPLYVVDTLAHRVFGLHTDGTLEPSFGGRGEEAPSSFNFPTHVSARRPGGGRALRHRRAQLPDQLFDEHGHPLGAFGRHGDGSGDLAMPKGIAVDRDGVVYVADALFDNVQLFDRDGRFLLTLGARGNGFGEFWLPSGAFVERQQASSMSCDTYNRRVQVFRIAGAVMPASSS